MEGCVSRKNVCNSTSFSHKEDIYVWSFLIWHLDLKYTHHIYVLNVRTNIFVVRTDCWKLDLDFLDLDWLEGLWKISFL